MACLSVIIRVILALLELLLPLPFFFEEYDKNWENWFYSINDSEFSSEAIWSWPSVLESLLLAAPQGIWDPTSPARAQTCVPCIGIWVLTTGPPGKSPHLSLGIQQTLIQSSHVSGSVLSLQAKQITVTIIRTTLIITRLRYSLMAQLVRNPPAMLETSV